MKLGRLQSRLYVQKVANPISSVRDVSHSLYNHEWVKARKRFLFSSPICVYCDLNGYTVVANVVDHIIPHRGDSVLFWDQSNWQSLCTNCHSSVKQKEEKGKYRM